MLCTILLIGYIEYLQFSVAIVCCFDCIVVIFDHFVENVEILEKYLKRAHPLRECASTKWGADGIDCV